MSHPISLNQAVLKNADFAIKRVASRSSGFAEERTLFDRNCHPVTPYNFVIGQSRIDIASYGCGNAFLPTTSRVQHSISKLRVTERECEMVYSIEMKVAAAHNETRRLNLMLMRHADAPERNLALDNAAALPKLFSSENATDRRQFSISGKRHVQLKHIRRFSVACRCQ
jgi:hypothetical protein